MTRRLNLLLFGLLIIIGGPLWYLLLDSTPWNPATRELDIVQVRQLAESIPGPKPDRIDFENVAWRLVPGNFFAVGSGFKRRAIGILAYRLNVPGRPPIVIDTGTTPAYADELGMAHFDSNAQRRVDAAMRAADLILVTHEHGDHLGGLAAITSQGGGASIAARAALNRHQVPVGEPTLAAPWPSGLLIQPEIDDRKPQALAPGVVSLPAPGHTPGSQMIFVKLGSGEEYLFAGDTAVMAVSWKERRLPSRLITDFWVSQDRQALAGWLKALHRIGAANPRLHIIPGHDFDWLVDPDNHNGMVSMLHAESQKGAGK